MVERVLGQSRGRRSGVLAPILSSLLCGLRKDIGTLWASGVFICNLREFWGSRMMDCQVPSVKIPSEFVFSGMPRVSKTECVKGSLGQGSFETVTPGGALIN